MNLLTEIEEIPTDSEGIRANVQAMIRYTELGLDQPYEGDLQAVVAGVLRYAKLQLQRLLVHERADVDVVAWIARNLLELRLLSRYSLSSVDNLQRTVLKEIVDYRSLRRLLSKVEGHESEPDFADFTESVESMETWLKMEELDPGDHHFTISGLAKKTDQQQERDIAIWLSKYVHPTPLLLFGNRSFMFGDEARRGAVAAAQLYAALLLDEMPTMANELHKQRAT